MRVKIGDYTNPKIYDILYVREAPELGGYPFVLRRDYSPSVLTKGGMSMVTYAELIQFCIFIVGLVSLCYQIFKDKK